MLFRNSLKYRLILFSAAVLGVFFMLESVHAVEKYGRKSISSINQVLLTPSASEISGDMRSILMAEIKKKVEMPRFDYNDLPESMQAQFWRESREHFPKTMQNLSSIKASMEEAKRSLEGVENSLQDVQQHIEQQNKLIKSSKSKVDTSKYTLEKGKYEKQKIELTKRKSDLSKRKSDLLTQKSTEEDALFRQAEELLTATIAPTLVKILSDPELQQFRAKEYVDEAERNKFIVQKAKELGITGQDLEKVMNSAYVYMVVLTDYDRTLTTDQKTGKKEINYTLSGGIIWFKLVVSEEKTSMSLLQTIRIESTTSGSPDKASKVDADRSIFGNVARNFADKLKLETTKIPDFALKTGIMEVKGSKVGFPMGKKEGLYVDQKFRVFERQELDNKTIVEKKRGFFYVTRIGDNVSNIDQLSYGKMVIRGAQPGMQLREFPNPGIDLSFRFKAGRMKIEPGSLESPPYGLDVKEEVTVPVRILNLTLQYNVGRKIKISQTYITGGFSFGLASVKGATVKPYNKEPEMPLYGDLYVGFLKKIYIGRIAFYAEPLVQLQTLGLGRKDDKSGDEVSFDNSAYSFSPNVGMEFAVRENINIGVALGYTVPVASQNKWSGNHKPKEGSSVELFKEKVGPKVTYPERSLSFYLSYCIPKL